VLTSEELALNLVQRAREMSSASHECAMAPLAEASAIFVLKDGWSLGLDVTAHPSARSSILCEHFWLSAQLHPTGRSSTPSDWQNLGALVQAIVAATGYPAEAPAVEPVVPIEDAHPNNTHHWLWHSDGSPIEADALHAAADAVRLFHRVEEQMPVIVPPKTSRNDVCPCGSGKKFKRCHGAS